MDGITTSDKLLAQDDIDALLGEAGIEGSYESEKPIKRNIPPALRKKPVIRFAKRSDDEVKLTMSQLRNKAFLEREEDVKVIWNAQGNIPMISGAAMKIQDMDCISLGTLHDTHLVVKFIDSVKED